METRAEHLAWCKQRALNELSRADVNDEEAIRNALASFGSDCGTHPETKHHEQTLAALSLPMIMGGHIKSRPQMEAHIKGFN